MTIKRANKRNYLHLTYDGSLWRTRLNAKYVRRAQKIRRRRLFDHNNCYLDSTVLQVRDNKLVICCCASNMSEEVYVVVVVSSGND